MHRLLQVQKLTVNIGGKRVCHSLDLSIERGQRWGILGSNGVGKTTLLHTLAGLRVAATGNVLLDGTALTELSRRTIARHIGVLFQESQDAFPDTVINTVLIGRYPYHATWSWVGEDDEQAARNVLATLGLAGMEQRLVNTLSGGERRRVALATLLTQDPAIYLLDEPVNHLDLHHQMAVLELLSRRVRDSDKALVMTLHDVNLAARFCDNVLLLFGDGAITQGPAEEVLNLASLQQLYSHPLYAVAGPQGAVFLPD